MKLRKYVTYTWGPNSSDGLQTATSKSKFIDKKKKGIQKPLEVGKRSSNTDTTVTNQEIHALKSEGTLKQSNWEHLKKRLHGSSGKELNKANAADTKGCLKGPLCRESASEQSTQSIEITGPRRRKEASSVSMKSESLGRNPPWLSSKNFLPPVPEISTDGQMDIMAMQNYLRELYDYNVRLRDDFLAAQSVLGDIVNRLSPHSDICRE